MHVSVADPRWARPIASHVLETPRLVPQYGRDKLDRNMDMGRTVSSSCSMSTCYRLLALQVPSSEL